MALMQSDQGPYERRRSGHTHTEGKHVRTQGEEGVHTPRTEALGGASPVRAWISDLQLQDGDNKLLSQQPELSETASWILHAHPGGGGRLPAHGAPCTSAAGSPCDATLGRCPGPVAAMGWGGGRPWRLPTLCLQGAC